MKQQTPAAHDFSRKEMDADSVLNHQAQNAENAEQRMAFDFYYRLGRDRSLPKVASQTGRGERTVKDWSAKYRWQARVGEREKIAAEHSLTVQNVLAEQDLKKKHVNVFDIAITKAVGQVADGSVKIKTVSELIQLIDARWKLAARDAPTAAGIPSMHFHGPTQVDLGLEKMSRDERIRFLGDMLKGIMRVQTRPKMGEGTAVKTVVATGVRPTEETPAVDLAEFNDLEEVEDLGDALGGEVSLDIEE